MKNLKLLVVSVFGVALVMGGSMAYAEETPSGDAAKSKWEFVVIPYFWLIGIDGDLQVRGRGSGTSATFSDIASHLDFMGEVHVEAHKGKWGIFFDGTYLDLSITGTVTNHPYPSSGPLDGNLDLTELLIEIGGLYQVAQWRLGKERAANLEVLGGLRYWDLEGKLAMSSPVTGQSFSMSGSEDWIDPFFGFRLGMDLGKNFLPAIRGDIGGFGVGSDFSINASTQACRSFF